MPSSLPQQVVATGQVLFHRFYCKRSFVHFNVKRIAAACIWLASRVGENQRRAREVIDVFQRMECREEKQSTYNLDPSSKKMYTELKMDLTRCELHILRELSFICHVELPHKLMLSYIAVLGTPPRLLQEAWNLANDSLRSTLCVRLKPEVIACGVVYAAARRVHIPLPENPPWWEVFDADKKGIDEVCRVLGQLYSLPKAQYVPVCQEDGSFTSVSTIQPNTLCKVVANKTKVYSPAPNKTTSDPPSEMEKEKDGHTSRDQRRGRDCHEREREQEKERHASRDRRRRRDYYGRERNTMPLSGTEKKL